MKSGKRAQYTSIPRSGKADPALDAIAGNIEMLTGQKGTSNKRAVLVEDLEKLGFVSFKNNKLTSTIKPGTGEGGGGVTPDPPPVVEHPTPPQNVVGSGGFQYASLQWDRATYVGHAYAEIFINHVDHFAGSTRVGVTSTNFFSLTLPINGEGYFWVRFINVVGDIGPIQGAQGVHITTAGNIDDLLDEMKDKIDFEHLTPDVKDPIQKIPSIETGIKDVTDEVNNIVNTTIPALDKEVNDIQAEIDATIPKMTLDIDKLSESVREQWENADSLADSIIENALGADYDRDNNNARFAAIKNQQIVIVDDQQAMASEIKVLVAQFDGLSSEYTNLVKVVATNEETMTQQFTSLSSKIDDVEAGIYEDVYTKVQADHAIASATTALKSEIEDPNGSSLGATLHSNYYTETDTDKAIASATQLLKSEIEDPNGNSIGADLAQNYYTKTDTDSAISSIETSLKAEYKAGDKVNADEIDGVKTDLTTNYYTASQIDSNYYTKAEADQSLAAITTNLTAEFKAGDKVNADKIDETNNNLQNNFYSKAQIDTQFYTKADADSAIAAATQEIKSEIEDVNGNSIGADLSQNYYTKTDTDGAIAASSSSLSSEFKKADDDLSKRIDEINAGTADFYTKAEIDNNFYTKADADSAIAAATTTLKAQIEDPKGSSVGANLANNYYTSAESDSALAAATTALKSEIENPAGDSLGADLAKNYYTKVDTDSAIAAMGSTISSEYKAADKALEDKIDNIVTGGDFYTKAEIDQNFYTKADADSAIAAANTTLKAEIEDPNGSSLGAKLAQDYYTAVETDQAIASLETSISSEWLNESDVLGENDIENALGDDIEADKNRKNYAEITIKQSTFANDLTAIAETITKLNATVGDSQAQIESISQVVAEEKVVTAQKFEKLTSEVEGVSSNLSNNYYTKADTDGAIAVATTKLSSEYKAADDVLSGKIDDNVDAIKNVYTKAEIDSNFYTSADADKAIAEASTKLKAEIEDPNGNSLGASLETLSQTVADVDGYQEALWGVKATAGDVTASIGLVAKSDPNNPDINNAFFIVQDADFRVVYDDGTNTNSVVPVFGTMDNPKYDPDAPTDPSDPNFDPHKTNKKVLVIDTAAIRVADIHNLVAGDIIADSIVSNTTINAPIINSAEMNSSKITSSELVSDNYVIGTSGYRFWKDGAEINEDVVVNANFSASGVVSAIRKVNTPQTIYSSYRDRWLRTPLFGSIAIQQPRSWARVLQITLNLHLSENKSEYKGTGWGRLAVTYAGKTYYSRTYVIERQPDVDEPNTQADNNAIVYIDIPANAGGTINVYAEARSGTQGRVFGVDVTVSALSSDNVWHSLLLSNGTDLV
ncbi:tail fiber protein [Vibrio phage douglas 12A4]|uniref:tail fiber protein n=1 Tax=Vibrio phage douglas 12A4 TaxID=573171 RepID=UPI0002C13D0C|nr:tail fiber protein [Vibrio phage douglas 12A4]AGG58103.1 hypothetical protein VPAG_00067 [Vibrio phage douglas 12A4]